MENNNLDILKSIKKVEISDTVFEKLSQRILKRRSQTIPLYKVGIAASLLIGFLLFEVLLVEQKFKQNTPQEIEFIIVNDNHLYYE